MFEWTLVPALAEGRSAPLANAASEPWGVPLMSRRFRGIAAVALSLGGSGCSAGQEPNPCHQELEITVSVDADARVTWSPACGMAELAISESPAPGEPGPVRWWIQTRDHRNTIESGVRYGVGPGGTITVKPAETLETGTTYLVSLFYYTPFGDGQFMLGSAAGHFTR